MTRRKMKICILEKRFPDTRSLDFFNVVHFRWQATIIYLVIFNPTHCICHFRLFMLEKMKNINERNVFCTSPCLFNNRNYSCHLITSYFILFFLFCFGFFYPCMYPFMILSRVSLLNLQKEKKVFIYNKRYNKKT